MYKLLTRGNTKTLKGEKYGYMTFILHLAPHTLAGYGNMCPASTPGCRASCLNTAGRGGMFKPGESLVFNTNVVQQARLRKTRYFADDRAAFMRDLVEDICRAIKYSITRNHIPVFRLNGTSDIIWEKIPVLDYANIFEMFPSVQFYDYTKIMRKSITKISNYHVVFSRSETNKEQVKRAYQLGMNVAVVFDQVPSEFEGIEVINGDLHDLRFLDKPGTIVGLKAKGRAKKDYTGFVVRIGE